MSVFPYRRKYVHNSLKKARDKDTQRQKCLMVEVQTLCQLGGRDTMEGKGDFLRAVESTSCSSDE